jgi:hypothetical protein
MTGSIGALGIVIEKPGLTVSEVAQELDRRFPRCRFAPSTAYSALPQMARGGKRRPRVRCTYRDPGQERALDRYEATKEGLDAFRAWMYEQPSGAPTLRDALYGRIELCQLDDVPVLIRIAEEEALIAGDLYSAATTRLKDKVAERRARAKKDHLRRMREVLLYVDPIHWSSRHNRYEEIADRLREIAGEARIEVFERLLDG